ncbi:MAG: HypC/HybG/HupF family hydrogenase formation chaperone [Gemmatimonadota bacterium]|jgi:hydrogenase expression/formation protein HypC|nr:MAG: HypC/HybG/HupF family hydrogenase formation chaperone [Gemmatimonadota bacterium]
MCLGVPGRVVEVDGLIAIVDFWGIRRETRLDVIDEAVSPGDYILNHVGFAIRKIPAEEIEETLALYELLLRETEEDMMASDVRGEIEAAPGVGLGGAVGASGPLAGDGPEGQAREEDRTHGAGMPRGET